MRIPPPITPTLHRLPWLVTLALVCLLMASAQAQQVFRDRNWRVRVCVKENVEQLVLRGSGSYQILSAAGAPLGTIVGNRPYFIQITRGRPGSQTYRLVLHDMDGHLDREAVKLGVEAREKYNLPVKVLRLPAQGENESRIIVTVGEFGSAREATAHSRQLEGATIAYVYEDRAVAREGMVRLLGEQGSILANDPQRLRLVPLNLAEHSLSVLAIENNAWSQAQLNDARHYRGEIDLVINEQGTLTVVNDLWVEYYVYAVVPAEMGGFAPPEALKAQAVAARTEAVAKIQMGITPSTFFDFYDTAMFQVYRGKGDEVEAARRAVDETRGEILVHNGHAIDAVYSHSCGGVVSSSSEVWGTLNAGWSKSRHDRLDRAAPALGSWQACHEFTGSNHDAFCSPRQSGFPDYAKPNFRWTKNFSGREFSELADKLHGTGPVKDVVVERRAASGRIQELRIVGERRSVTVRGEQNVRRSMGSVRSTLFTFSKSSGADGRLERLAIQGAGWGHGVGMCQMGAFMMARRNYNYRQILGHYYNDVRIRQLYR